MSVKVVVGAQWGDEGKGKIVDILTGNADIVARYQGGHNAGHTVVVNDKQFILHLIPSGILHHGKKCIIGNGVAVDPSALFNELSELKKGGIDVDNNIFISKRAHLIMPYHKLLDMSMESAKVGKKIGTTGRGIGPAYTDKAGRLGIYVMDLFDRQIFREKLELNLSYKNVILQGLFKLKGFNTDEILEEYMGYAEKIKRYVADTKLMIRDAILRGERILCEGAQGTMLDIDHGTYPYVTSSSTTVGGACIGLGIPPQKIDEVIGVAKAYTTRVGEGPFPTELKGREGGLLREEGGEYGATTGRPRRCGWFDAVVVKYTVWLNGMKGITITKLDVLDKFDKIYVCTGYKFKGMLYTEVPDEIHIIENGEPVYKEIEGWEKNTCGITDFRLLPDNAKRYIDEISNLVGAEIKIISTGKKREETIMM
ncbi:MAG: adenylosuccinate synthase [Nitrospinota bacterium]